MLTIRCNNCSKSYKLPTDKLPQGKKFALPCPNCKAKITVDLREPAPTMNLTRTRRSFKPGGLKKKFTRKNGKSQPELSGIALKKKILNSVEELPSMPQVVEKAKKVMASRTSGIKELTRVIETDQAIASRMIKLANSAFYGLSGKVTTVMKANTMLGQQTLREVITTAGYSKLMDHTLVGYGYASGDLWRHSIAVGLGARIIAEIKKVEDTDAAYLAGLIHDSGKIVLDPYIMERKAQFKQFLKDESLTFLKAERHLLGFDHAHIASAICKKWNIPDEIAKAVRYHHTPAFSESNTLSYIVHLADQIAKSGGLGYEEDDYLAEIEAGVLEFLGLSQNAVQMISSKIIETMLKFQD